MNDQEIGWHEGRFKWQVALLAGEGGKALQSFPPAPASVCSQCPPRHVKPRAESRGHFSHRLLSFPTHVSDTKKPNKTNPHKTQPWFTCKELMYNQNTQITQREHLLDKPHFGFGEF